jgi:tetratricopeptide (TPR) repeat protein
MARDVGLDAFYVNVDKDTAGKAVAHVCAAVFLDGKVLLPDVTYRWFGAPHKEFQVLDDFQATALELALQDCLPDPVRCRRLAARVWPESRLVWLQLGLTLATAGQWTEARSALDEARKLGSEHWQAYALQGYLAGHDGKLDKAELYLRAAVLINPEDARCHYELGKILQLVRKLAEAREELRAALRCRPDATIESKARRRLAEVEEALAGDASGVPSER